MVEQEKLSRRSRWSVTSYIAVALFTLIVSAAAVGYAVENEILELPWRRTTTFIIEDDAVNGDVMGYEKNEDGTFTLKIRLEPEKEGKEPEIRVTTDKPLNGRKIIIARPKPE